ncbi:S-type pyocin domain-containing protein, partial [Erwinia sp. ErVv1]|uniref:S-type pyocin domain-containing protein n=1 Tax=Erwinia sp. ErVv1 TaxID=1603299 RepID=UPI000A9E6512
GTVIKPVGTIQITTTPVADPGGMQDFVYWQPDASGSGVQPVYVVLSNPRNRLGKVSGKGEPVGGDWLTNAGKDLGAPIPSQIADKLQGREFANFDAFREAFWKDVGRDPVLIKQFRENNKRNLMKGYSPFPIPSEQVGGRIRFELHHVKFIKDNGAIYDIDNIRVMTPKRHIEIHKEDN